MMNHADIIGPQLRDPFRHFGGRNTANFDANVSRLHDSLSHRSAIQSTHWAQRFPKSAAIAETISFGFGCLHSLSTGIPCVFMPSEVVAPILTVFG